MQKFSSRFVAKNQPILKVQKLFERYHSIKSCKLVSKIIYLVNLFKLNNLQYVYTIMLYINSKILKNYIIYDYANYLYMTERPCNSSQAKMPLTPSKEFSLTNNKSSTIKTIKYFIMFINIVNSFFYEMNYRKYTNRFRIIVIIIV